MTNFGRVRGTVKPPAIEITASAVFVSSNITSYQEIVDDREMNGYEYDYISYAKDEYITLLGIQNEQLLAELLDTQEALCDIYESIGGLE